MNREHEKGRPSKDSDLNRFVVAQEGIYAAALWQIRRGRKTDHWMWFIFPQTSGLGHSAMSVRYGISSLAEARAYIEHPLLGLRLRECVAALQDLTGTSAEAIFGNVDAQKLCSCLTLFAAADPGQQIFEAALGRWFGGQRDNRTLKILAQVGPKTQP